ncbi:AAA family ATPase [Allochromatium humboldtianum]|uniref:AAA family ATPase n=1 Tax=Allochromatium humboldtianum TaxID=504901 RepID=A0A850R8H9_9GAMM|nr:AAA family ATPase [Allochromatium humboldtianum]
MATGFAELDRMTMGLHSSELTLVAGRPGMGTGSFVQCVAEEVAVQAQRPVAFFSLRLPRETLFERLSASRAHVLLGDGRAHPFQTDERERLIAAKHRLLSAPLYIDDTPAISPSEVRERATALKDRHNDLGLIVVDYLQLMSGANALKEHAATETVGSRALELSDIAQALQAVARELEAPVLVRALLARHIEYRSDRRPRLTDLSRSGPIAPHADLVIFLYRDEVYEQDSPDAGLAEITVAKTHHGTTGTVRLACSSLRCRTS